MEMFILGLFYNSNELPARQCHATEFSRKIALSGLRFVVAIGGPSRFRS